MYLSFVFCFDVDSIHSLELPQISLSTAMQAAVVFSNRQPFIHTDLAMICVQFSIMVDQVGRDPNLGFSVFTSRGNIHP